LTAISQKIKRGHLSLFAAQNATAGLQLVGPAVAALRQFNPSGEGIDQNPLAIWGNTPAARGWGGW
jgi:hypothetical protein